MPFWAPAKYFDLYPKDKLDISAEPADDWDDIPEIAMSKRFKAFGFELGRENDSLRRAYTQAYHACISFIDAQFNVLFDSLRKNGLWENTIIVLTSDHGYHLGEHFMWGKVTLFEECARVPLIMRVPGYKSAGETTEGLVELIDCYPTLAIRTKRWRYAEWGGQKDCELYYLKEDPSEHSNLAANPKFRKKLEEMRVLLADVRAKASTKGTS